MKISDFIATIFGHRWVFRCIFENMNITPEIQRWASFGMSLPWLSRRTGYPVNRLASAVRRGLLIRPPLAKAKYYCDYDFFSVIDTEEKAYWLGFLYADGCVTDAGGVNLLLGGQDKAHLVKYVKSINAEHPVEERHDAIRYNGVFHHMQHNVKVRLYSKRMAADLLKLGVGPRKSLTLTFPNHQQVPPDLLHHFVRGYFDGDGSISWSSRHRYNGHWALSIIATDAFNEKMLGMLNKEIGLRTANLRPHPNTRGMSYLNIYSIPDMNRFRDYIYRDATVYLDRKMERFRQLPIRYYSSLVEEAVATASTKIAAQKWITFTSREIAQLYGVTRKAIFGVISALEKAAIIKRTGNRGRQIIYQLA